MTIEPLRSIEKIFTSCLYLNRMFIIIPKEYWNKQVEILVFPLNEMVQKVKDKKKNLQELLSLESIDIEEVKVSDWCVFCICSWSVVVGLMWAPSRS